MTAAELGFDGTKTTVTLFVEAVGHSTQHYSAPKAIKVQLATDGIIYTEPDTVLVRAVYNSVGWKIVARRFAQFDLSTWNPSLGFGPNEKNVRAIYYGYRKIYNLDPQKFIWAGGARVAGGMVLHSLRLMDRPERYFAPISFLPGFGAWRAAGAALEAAVAPIRQKWMEIAFAIFDDIAWQHLAYHYGSIQEIRRITGLKEIPDGTDGVRDVNVSSAWEAIHSGGIGVRQGGLSLVDHEQTVVIESHYDFLDTYSVTVGPWTVTGREALTYLSQFRDPVKGMKTFYAWKAEKGNEDIWITNHTHRMQYMIEVLWPFWADSLSATGREFFIKKSLDELAEW